ncbi:peptide deformylase [Colwellia hornerae]|uniref:Peptide deformylase n=1 Tax=Colwellia hornerae TaxID=89402 RepID=A0A5C6QSB1_9GAMM|nr:peptide deformylase [Colwellia hornerae]TWX57723.1 peptide deformylase [Colwellia hornerae]TWX62546.1 peptide deformylase [Colwellia hornerae]TWX71458.1 peptide deformylase [Colwellia hornerae]
MKVIKSAPYSIAQLGHAVLRLRAAEVENIQSNECQQLINKMLLAVSEAGGVGIAAPQIHHSVRIFIICSKPNERYPNAPLMPATAMINPEILTSSAETTKGWEGCLSVPSMRGFVPRHNNITVRYYDRQGVEQLKEFTGFIARIFQHELDHLNGFTFIDQLTSTKDLISEVEWFQQFA